MPTEIEDYLFDLRGYLLVENALDQAELNALNTIVDELSPSPQQEAERAALEREAAIAAHADGFAPRCRDDRFRCRMDV